jgi:DNA-binding SARP family transcriptional activator
MLRLDVLGVPLVYAADGRLLQLPSSKAVALLVYLSLQTGFVSRPELAALLWDDDRATRDLNQVLFKIRRAIDKDPFESRGELLGLQAQTDFAEFERLGKQTDQASAFAALELWRGSLLEGIHFRGASLMHDWVSEKRAYLETLRLKLLARKARLEPDPQRRASYWAAYLELEPLDEPSHRELISLFLALNQPQAAVAQYERCRAALANLLGVIPTQQTEALFTSVRQAPATQQETLPMRLAHPIFVGRETEQAMLEGYLERASGLVFVLGEAGIGKTRLVKEVTRVDATWALKAYADLRDAPFHPFLDDLRAARQTQSGLWLSLDPVWRTQLERILPESRARHLPTDRLANLEALRQWIIANDSRVLWLDDLHWADTATFELVEYVARRGVLVVATLRPEDETPLLRTLYQNLLRQGCAWVLELPRLLEQDLEKLLRHLVSKAMSEKNSDFSAITKRVFAESQGNPLFALELTKSLYEAKLLSDSQTTLPDHLPLPPSIHGLLQARLERLSPAARQLCDAAAVLGSSLSPSSLQRVAGRSSLEVADGLDELQKAHILVESAQGLHFSHDRLLEVVYGSLNTLRRSLLHQRAARSLERLGVTPLVIAQHHERGEQPSRARAWFIRAGDSAVRSLSFDAAIHAYEAALHLAGSNPKLRLPLHAALARVCARVGRFAQGYAQTQVWEEAATTLQQQPQLIAARIEQSSLLWQQGQLEQASLVADGAAVLARATNNQSLEHHALLNAAYAHDLQGAFAVALERLERAEAIVPESPDQRARRLSSRAVTLSQLGRSQESLACLEEALHHYVQIGGIDEQIRLRTNITYALNLLGRPEEAAKSGQQALQLADQWQLKPRILMASLNLGVAWRELGQLQLAHQTLQQGVLVAEELGAQDQLPLLLHALGFTLEMDNQLGLAASILERGVRLAREVGRARALAENLTRLAQVYRRQQQFDQAQALALEALEQARALHHGAWEIRARTQLAQIALDVHRLEVATEQITIATKLYQADPNAIPWIFGRETHLVEIGVLLAQGQKSRASAATRVALEQFQVQLQAIHDPELRHLFQNAIPAHHDLLKIAHTLGILSTPTLSYQVKLFNRLSD